MEIKLTHEDEQNICFALCGELDINSIPVFKREVEAAIKDQKKSLIFDCSELKYIDSTGLGVMVSVLKKVREYGGAIHMRTLKPYLYKIFEITGLINAFKIEVEA